MRNKERRSGRLFTPFACPASNSAPLKTTLVRNTTLQTGDVITRVNDVDIRDPRQLLLVVSQLAPETEVTVDYLRDGEKKTATATLARRPDQEIAGGTSGGGADRGVLNGVGVGDLTPEVRQQYDIPERIAGVIVTNVQPDSAAAREGLREGDVILELNRQPVENARDAVRLSGQIKGPTVLLRLWREGRSQFVVVDETEK